MGDVGSQSITVAELHYGAQKSSRPKQNADALAMFLLPLVVADFDYQAAEVYGQIRAHLETAGKPIGPLDTLIAAHAVSLGVVLITNNTGELRRVPQLQSENWL